MQIEPSHQAVLLSETRVPLQLHRYTIPFAEVHYREYPVGHVLRQTLRGNGFSIDHFLIRMIASNAVEWLAGSDADALLYMRRNSMTLEFASGRQALFEEGTFRQVSLDERDKGWTVLSAGTYCFLLVSFAASDCGMGVSDSAWSIAGGMHEPENDRPFPIHLQVRDILDEIANKVTGWRQRQLLVESAVRQLLVLYLEAVEKRRLEAGGERTGYRDSLRMLEEYIDGHLDEALSVERLARKAMMSRSWLQRIAQQYYGKGIYELVRDKRMHEASRLLLRSVLPVGTIASRVSDMTISAFSATFKKYFGQSPRQYRQNGGQTGQTAPDEFANNR